jgi:oligopeptide transport system substrate-binding protein
MKISVILGLTLFSLSACNAKVSTPFRETLRVQMPSEPSHLNPYLAETGAEMVILRHLVRAPLRFAADGRWDGDAAQSYSWNETGFELSVRFREGLKWSDGVPLTACHYRAGILRMLGKGSGLPSPLSELYRNLKGYSSALAGKYFEMEAALRCTDRELILTSLKPRDRSLLNALAFLGSAPWRDGLDAEHRVSSGPFRLVEWKKGRSIKIAAVDPSQFLSSNVEFIFVRDSDTALIMYEKGDLEVLTEVPQALLPKLKGRPDFHRVPMMATYYVAFDFRKGGLWARDVRLRRALALSAGREEIPSLLQGGERAAYTLNPDDLLPSSELAAFRREHTEDVAEAKRLWKEASSNSKPPKKLALGYPSGSRHQLLMERLANNWQRRLGLEVTFEPQEWNHYIDVLKKSPPELFRYAWTAVYPDPRFFLSIFEGSSLNNFGQWLSKDFDQKLAALDPSSREDADFWKKVFEAEELLVWKEAALIPLYHYSKTYMARGELGRKLGFTYNGFVDLTRLTKNE